VGLLVRHFWRKLDLADQPLPDDLVARFEAYAWPGNVRELRNAVARRLALGDLSVDPGMTRRGSAAPPPLPPSPAPAQRTPASADFLDSVLSRDLPLPRARQEVVDEFERRYVARVLDRHGGNVTRAASASGIARRYFYAIKNRVGG
jgi:DNA-binding NtrC family response regulator